MIGYWSAEDRKKQLDQPNQFFQCIRILERAVKGGMTEQIFKVRCYEGRSEIMYADTGARILPKGTKAEQREAGRNALLEIARIKWSVEFALDKLALCKIGLIRPKKDGDLRTAELLPSQEQALNLFRWKRFRENPGLFEHIVLHAIKIGDSSFLRRLSDTVAKPAREFHPEPTSPRERLQMFVLKSWQREARAKCGDPHPDLCEFTDDAMLAYLQEMLSKAQEVGRDTSYLDAVENMDSRSLRYVWERLGLVRLKRPMFQSVEWDNARRNLLKREKLLIRNWK